MAGSEQASSTAESGAPSPLPWVLALAVVGGGGWMLGRSTSAPSSPQVPQPAPQVAVASPQHDSHRAPRVRSLPQTTPDDHDHPSTHEAVGPGVSPQHASVNPPAPAPRAPAKAPAHDGAQPGTAVALTSPPDSERALEVRPVLGALAVRPLRMGFAPRAGAPGEEPLPEVPLVGVSLTVRGPDGSVRESRHSFSGDQPVSLLATSGLADGLYQYAVTPILQAAPVAPADQDGPVDANGRSTSSAAYRIRSRLRPLETESGSFRILNGQFVSSDVIESDSDTE